MAGNNPTGTPAGVPKTALEAWRQIGDEQRLAADHLDRARELMRRLFVAMPIERWNEPLRGDWK